MKVIGYLNKHNSPKELIEAHTLIKSFSEVIMILFKDDLIFFVL